MIFHRPLLLIAATLPFASLALGQEVTTPTLPSGEVAPPGTVPGPRLTTPGTTSGGIVPLVTPAATDTPLMPDQTPSLVKPEAPVEKKPEKLSKTEVFSQDLLERIHFREVRTKALDDRAVISEWDRAGAARTDLEKRAALKNYYKLLYARMMKIDSSLKKLIDVKAVEADHRLTQARISPTEARDDAERSTSGRVFAD